MNTKNIGLALFAYNFPHKKTQDFIFRTLAGGYSISCILAADAVKLNIPESSIRTKIRHTGLVHPSAIASAFEIPYYVVAHDDPKISSLVQEHEIKLGLISGARILKRPVIDGFSIGIINFHPGLIPHARGLDALLWSIHHDVPLGVTSHLIDHRVDAGRILEARPIKLYQDDTLLDLSERLYDIQLDMLPEAVERSLEGQWTQPDDFGAYNKKMPPELEATIAPELPAYLSRRV